MKATADSSALQVMLQGEDHEQSALLWVCMQGRQAAGKPLDGVLLYEQTNAAHIRQQGRTTELVDVQPTSTTSRRLHCSSSAERSGPVR